MALKPDKWDLEVDFVSIGSGLAAYVTWQFDQTLGKGLQFSRKVSRHQR